MSGAGDVNGDGYIDFVIGGTFLDGTNSAAVVFGQPLVLPYFDVDLTDPMFATGDNQQGFHVRCLFWCFIMLNYDVFANRWCFWYVEYIHTYIINQYI